MDLHPNERVLFEGHPSWRSILGFYIKGILIVGVAAVIAVILAETGVVVAVIAGGLGVLLLIGFLKRWATVYTITNERLRIKRGIIARRVQQTTIDRIQNVNTNQSALERILQVGTVDFDTAGTDDSDFKFRGVEDPEEVVAAVDSARKSTGSTAQ